MPRDMTAQQIADLTDPDIPKLVVWMLELDLGSQFIRCSDSFETIIYNLANVEPQGGKWKIPTEISTGQALVPQEIQIEFDGNDQFVSGSLTERIITDEWFQRSITLRCVMYNANTGIFIVEPFTIFGVMDFMEIPEGTGHETPMTITMETGTFRVNERRHTICADRDQRRRVSTDGFFRNTAVKNSEAIPFGVEDQNVPGMSSSQGGGGSNNIFGPGGGFNRWLL